eukprot:jgi/Astpho2/1276/Aster-07120
MRVPHVNQEVSLHSKDQPSVARGVSRTLLKDWGKLSDDEIEVTKVSGGITNVLLKLQPADWCQLEPVLFRIFGDKTDLLIDREQEARVILQLNTAGFGAQVLGTFENGRIEAWIHMRPLKPEEMSQPHFSSRIAQRLAQFHAVNVKEPREPELFKLILKWLGMARELHFEDSQKQAAIRALDLDAMQHEIEQMEATCMRLESPVVWSHNDLLSGNIMAGSDVNPHETKAAVGPGTMQFIDFEYSCYSFRGYDFGNHFDEYAGFECEYSRYPNKQATAAFMRQYLRQQLGKLPSKADVDKAVVEANAFALVAHQYWGVWALIQARYSPIDFDYMDYSSLRWKEYHNCKAEFLGDAEAFLECRDA